jgi:acyl-CoA synthetase (AMP-forming)/AMP-acid ligase II
VAICIAVTFSGVHRYNGVVASNTLGLPAPIAALVDRAAHAPDAPCLTTIAADGTPTTLTYRDVSVATSRLAVSLRTSLDLRPGTIVALSPLNDAPSVLAVLALMRIGCPTLFLNPADPPQRQQQQAAALGVSRMLCSPNVSAPVPGAVAIATDALHDTRLDARADADALVHRGDAALYFPTSGSTAASKLVEQSHLNVAANAAGVGLHHGLDRETRLLSCLPIHHVNALHLAVFATLIAGGHTILSASFDPLSFPRLIERWAPRIVSVVPTVLDALLRIWRQPRIPEALEYFVTAAAPLQGRTAAEVRERFGRPVLQGYGLTETTNFSTTMPRGLPDADYRRYMIDCEIPSIGVAIEGNEVAVLRRDGTAAADGEAGEIVMRGHNVMNGYARNETATREAFDGDWFHSGDLGYATADGSGRRFFVITGRLKNVAKVHGESVSLEEMDRALCQHPGVDDAACVSVPDPVLGEAIVAAVSVTDGFDEAALRETLARQFPIAVLPRRFVRLASIPRTSTGKLRRHQLAEQLQGER